MSGKITAIYISEKKGQRDKIEKCILRRNHGLVGDRKAGPGKRQVCLLTKESIDTLREQGVKIGCSGFGENITVSGTEVEHLVEGMNIKVGDAVLKLTEKGKMCKKPCKFYSDGARCQLSMLGVFTAVVKGGKIAIGNDVEVIT